MPFWSKRSNASENGNNLAASKDFSTEDSSEFENHIPLSSQFSSPSSLSSDSRNGVAGLGEMQQFALALQQQVIVQQVINNLTDQAFQKCITGKPSDSLSGKDAACVQATVMKWLDTNEFLMGRLAKKTQGGQ